MKLQRDLPPGERGDEYRVGRVLQGMFFSFTVGLAPPWKRLLCYLLSEGSVISSGSSTSRWLAVSPWVEKREMMLRRETRPVPLTGTG